MREAHVKGLAVVGESKVGYIYSKALEKHLGGVFNSPKNYFLLKKKCLTFFSGKGLEKYILCALQRK